MRKYVLLSKTEITKQKKKKANKQKQHKLVPHIYYVDCFVSWQIEKSSPDNSDTSVPPELSCYQFFFSNLKTQTNKQRASSMASIDGEAQMNRCIFCFIQSYELDGSLSRSSGHDSQVDCAKLRNIYNLNTVVSIGVSVRKTFWQRYFMTLWWDVLTLIVPYLFMNRTWWQNTLKGTCIKKEFTFSFKMNKYVIESNVCQFLLPSLKWYIFNWSQVLF